MSHKLSSVVGAGLLGASLLLSRGAVFAAAPAMGSSNAAAIPSGPVTINPGQQLWYSFNYAGDDSQVNIEMRVNQPYTAGFAVWTPELLHEWAADSDTKPIGRGTVLHDGGDNHDVSDIHDPKHLDWNGAFTSAGTYSVVVENPSSVPASFTLSIAGTGVSSITAPMTAAAASAPAAAAAQVKSAAKPAAGASVETALPFPPGRIVAAKGSRTWYAFQYPGDKAQVMIQAGVEPHGTVAFAVWTPERLKEWATDFQTKPIGRGTPLFTGGRNQDTGSRIVDPGDLVWDGTFDAPGTYYVMVDQIGPDAGSYTLTLSITPASESGSGS